MAEKREKAAPNQKWVVKRSRIHGTGIFAARNIRKNARVIEYTGERITQEEADRRYDDEAGEGHAHVVLFSLEDGTCIDGGSGGNEARFVNHSCEPNCESSEVKGRIFVSAIRAIRAGEEITYDYRLDYCSGLSAQDRKRYACRCGTPSCRGTQLAPQEE